MQFYQVDVFSQTVLGGNGLTVVLAEGFLDENLMLKIAQEFKQFETVFVFPQENNIFPLRIFTVQEELPFAGHPILGTAGLLHRVLYPGKREINLSIKLGNRIICVTSREEGSFHSVVMNQGKPQFLGLVDRNRYASICASISCSEKDLYPGYPLEVVSTGLPYLLVPIRGVLPNLHIANPDFESLLSGFGAKFAYVFDPESMECRSWDNSGIFEDSATGSAAGPLVAYLVSHGYKERGKPIMIKQGRFVYRPSILTGWMESGKPGNIFIKGEVALFASGTLVVPQ
ncbi:phenazine biosynthesis protein PhzF family [Sphaerochaeta pleomorpha str. Grapes]|uniref:Phenazine biosynthesis protein PhzF family n=1 Tax=Sphaerochaeta pleomorpha (strain ATCC BAA-1885 / DSM 22778 / Grapes) TaxID=158190 RepID=G8QV82_SPHPG|nr:PhzF family phenazine biosynthesis protein [Sphaerochaeta pleomorpha]AEV30397.1 phenazine biosynthesis protein PhzF family [Sphaerochaeta pleomorpha str. Grapes]